MLLLLLVSCVRWIAEDPWLVDGSRWDSLDTGQPTTPTNNDATPPQIVSVEGGCDGGSLGATILTDGWSQGALLHVFRASDARMEIHPMRLVDLDPQGAWDERRVGPLEQSQPEPYVAAETSVFDCGVEAGQLAYAIRLEGAEATITDCVRWGGEGLEALGEALELLDPQVGALGCRVLEPTPGGSGDTAPPDTGAPSTTDPYTTDTGPAGTP